VLKKSLGRSLFLAFVFSLVIACAAQPVRQERLYGGNPLWKVTAGNGDTLYLLGSVHVLDRRNYPLSDAIENAFTESQTVVFEVDFDEASATTKRVVFEKGIYRSGRTLRQSISPKSYGAAGQKLKGFGIAIERLDNLKPWAVALTITTLELGRLGFDPSRGVDRYFFEKAKVAGKEISALETIEYQMGLFNGMSDRDQERFLMQTLTELDVMESSLNELIKAWKRGDSRGLEAIVLESCREFRKTCNSVIFERNRAWLLEIENLLHREGTKMVVVGTAHLVGSKGLVELLRKSGYSVAQL